MNRIILEHGVYTRVKVDGASSFVSAKPKAEPQTVALPKFALDDVVNLYDVLPMLSYDADDTMTIIYDIELNYNHERTRSVYSETSTGTKIQRL